MSLLKGYRRPNDKVHELLKERDIAAFKEKQYAIMASPEKALCDKVVTTTGIILRSQKSAAAYLIEDLRMDEDILKGLNSRMMSSWLPDAPKRDSLSMVIKMIEKL